MIGGKRLEALATGGAAVKELFEAARRAREAGRRPVDLSLGNPDLKPPQAYLEALSEVVRESLSSQQSLHGYMPNAGYPETRERLASELTGRFALPFSASHLLMTAGAANGLEVALSTLVDPLVQYRDGSPELRSGGSGRRSLQADEVIVPAPYFVEYPNLVESCQGRMVAVHGQVPHTLEVAAVEAALGPRSRVLLLNSPNNPTGAVYGRAELEALAKALERTNREHGITVVVLEDVSYDRLTFDGAPPPSMLSCYPFTVVTGSFSKSLSLAGERIGYLAVHPTLAGGREGGKLLAGLAINLRIRVVNAPALQQRVLTRIGFSACLPAAPYARRARTLGAALRRLGFRFRPPAAGFYIFAELPEGIPGEGEFRQAALAGQEPLLYVPGAAFGGPRYARYLRFSVCAPEEDIQRACRRLEEIVAAARG